MANRPPPGRKAPPAPEPAPQPAKRREQSTIWTLSVFVKKVGTVLHQQSRTKNQVPDLGHGDSRPAPHACARHPRGCLLKRSPLGGFFTDSSTSDFSKQNQKESECNFGKNFPQSGISRAFLPQKTARECPAYWYQAPDLSPARKAGHAFTSKKSDIHNKHTLTNSLFLSDDVHIRFSLRWETAKRYTCQSIQYNRQ